MSTKISVWLHHQSCRRPGSTVSSEVAKHSQGPFHVCGQSWQVAGLEVSVRPDSTCCSETACTYLYEDSTVFSVVHGLAREKERALRKIANP